VAGFGGFQVWRSSASQWPSRFVPPSPYTPLTNSVGRFSREVNELKYHEKNGA